MLSILLYDADTWTTYRKQELKLNSFHLRCLHTILGIKWQEQITNLEILQRCNSTPLSSILKQRRLRWLDHVHCVPIDRLPKQIMYGDLTGFKRDLKYYGIDPVHWQTVAEERPTWRTNLTGGPAIDIKAYQIHQEIKRARRHARNQQT